MSKKIGILTFHSAHNFGAMLQAYAMQTFLEKLGYEVKIIDHYSYAQKAQYPKFPIDFKLATIRYILNHPILTFQKYQGWYKYRDFMRNHLNLTYYACSVSAVKDVIDEENFDIILCAGDQIWNINLYDFTIAYLLPFQTKAKKIAYAPSLGGNFSYWNPEDNTILYKSLLSDFSSISVREETASKILSRMLKHPVPVMPDTAWLATEQDYLKIMSHPNTPLVSGRYLLYYSPSTDATIDWAISYAKAKNKKLVAISQLDLRYKNISYFLNAGPAEFLNLVMYADEVVGCSLHMIIFSVIFNKDFLVLQHMNDSRIIDLINSLNLNDRLVSIETNPSTLLKPSSNVRNMTAPIVSGFKKSALSFFNENLSF